MTAALQGRTLVSLGFTWLDAVVWGVITFSILIVLHEGGHFLAARAFRVKVHDFMIGLPGPALSVVSKRSGTRYGVTAVPLGGYVRIAGMDFGPEDDLLGRALAVAADAGTLWTSDLARELDVELERAQAIATTLVDWGALEHLDEDGTHLRALVARYDGEADADLAARARVSTYRGLATWKRIVLLTAGILVNVVVAYTVLVAVIAVAGEATASTRVADVSHGAKAAGIAAGDRFLSVDGVDVSTFAEVKARVARHTAGDVITVRVDRGGEALTLPVTLTAVDDGAGGKAVVMGVSAALDYGPVPLGEAFGTAAQLVTLVGAAILSFFNPDTFREAVAGARSVIGASEEIAKAVKAGPVDYAWLVALLSLSLGLMNLVPIPPLDGGKVLLELVERAIGRPLSRKFSIALSASGAVLLFSLVGYLMYADVARLITG
ncbi:MAG: site-2 protease family protein [Actinobacteria bacterium]|nr:MAG: site-2 protease family protein [Actinomycetota bacterium]